MRRTHASNRPACMDGHRETRGEPIHYPPSHDDGEEADELITDVDCLDLAAHDSDD